MLKNKMVILEIGFFTHRIEKKWTNRSQSKRSSSDSKWVDHVVYARTIQGENWTVFLSNAESGRSETFRNKEFNRQLVFRFPKCLFTDIN